MSTPDLTLFLARMMAPYLFVTGLGFIISKAFYLKMLNEAEQEHPISINLSGMVHFFIGMAVVLTHCRWSNHLEIAVSLIGISFVLKGCVLIAIPTLSMKSNKSTLKRLPFIAGVFLSMSFYLAWASYLSPIFSQ